MAVVLAFAMVTLFGFFYEVRRQESLAQSVALATVRSAMANKEARLKAGIPGSLGLRSEAPVDTDLFERRWDIWYATTPHGAIHVSILAPRGFAFLPIFNRAEDLKLLEITYEPTANWP